MPESDIKYQMLFNAIDEGFCIIEMIFDKDENPVDYRFLEVNPSFEKQTGLFNAKGRRMKELAPGHEKHWFETYGKIALTGQPERFENRAEELHRWYEVYAFRVGQPKDLQVAILFNDITQRKHAEEEIKRIENLRNSLLDNLPFMALILKKHTREIVAANKFAVEAGAVTGKICYETIAHCNYNCPFCKAPDLWETGKEQFVEAEYIGRHWEGRWIPFTGELYVHYIIDITKRKQAEELLKESTERLAEAQKLAHIGIWDWKIDTDTVTWTAELYSIAGLDPMLPAPTYKEHSSLYTHESWELLKTGVEKAMKTGESYQFELELIRPDGETRNVNAFGGAKFDSKGKVNGLFGTVQDITERKQVEEALQKSDELLRIVFSNAPISIFATDDKGIFILHEGKALAGAGMKPGENVGISAYKLFSDLKVVDYNGNVIKGKSVLDRVLHGENLSGITELNDVIFDNQFVPIIDINGHIMGLIGVATDITESRKAEASLIESEAKFRSLFENSLIGISIARSDGRLLQVNQAYARLYGYENPEQLLSEVSDTTVLFAHPEERKEVLQELKGSCFMEAREFELIRRDGSHFFALVSASEIRDYWGKLLFNQATHIDLTERRKIEEQIRAASLYSRSLIEASLDPLVTINAEGKITDVNISTEQITGIGREELTGTDFADYFTSPDKARNGYKKVFSKGVVKDYPLTILNKSGKKIDVLYNATLFKNEAGQVQGVFAAARDITDMKKMEMELRTSKKSLEKLHRHIMDVRENERSQIALNLHDDLGQKLTAINLNISWIKSRIGVQSKIVKEKFEEMSHIINESIDSIREISSFLRPTILFDLGLVPAFTWQLQKFEKQSGIKCYFNNELGELKIDDSVSLILFRVLQESITNIARHSEASEAEITLSRVSNKIDMLIKDNGIGINEEKTNSPDSMGITGIKERVESVGGSVNIKGKKGYWTFIKVSIPLKAKRDND